MKLFTIAHPKIEAFAKIAGPQESWSLDESKRAERYEAYEQLAMYYERKTRNPEQARQVVLQALHELRRANQVGDITPDAYREFKVKFDLRLERLERESRRPYWTPPICKLTHKR